jgi:hypothetical protein
MAIPLPSRPTPLTQNTTNSTSLLLALRSWHRRILLQQAACWLLRGGIAGLLLANLVLLLAHLFPWAGATAWAIGIGAACLLCALVAALRFRPSLARAARIVDRRLGLHDRLGTAWELRDETSSLAQLQRRDALQQLEQHTPAKTFSLHPGRFALLLFAIAALAFLLLVVLPNPMNAVLKQQAMFQARITTQIKHIEQLRKELAQQSTLSAQQKAQADQILHDLEKQLQQAKNPTEAQQALAQAQARLDQLRNPQTANNAAAQSAAAAALQGNPNANLNALGQALANNDTKGLASALKNLASQVSHLSAAQRSQLAQQIESAANQAGQDANLSSALHQLAKSIADGNASEVSDAANAAQAAADQNASAQAQDNSITQAEQGVQQAANNLASATDGSNPLAQGQSQQGQQGQGQGQGQQGQGQGQGQQGQQGQNQGQGQGQQGQGRGGAGGNNGAGSQPGKNEQVYVPGLIGSGNSSQDNNGNTGEVQPGSSEPFSQVIEQYSQMAHDAIDSSDLPPDMKDLIESYFNSLEGQ